jgi:hypothetical protein
MLRFAPRRLGSLAARDAEIVYTTGGRRRTLHFTFQGSVNVDGTGPDDRDTDTIPQAPPLPSPTRGISTPRRR